MTLEGKFLITEEELQKALKECHQTVEPKPSKEEISHRWNLNGSNSEIFGLHIRAHQSFLTRMHGLEIKEKNTIKSGFEEPTKLFKDLAPFFKPGKSFPLIVTLSGKYSHFFVTKAPHASRNVLAKSFTLQMRQISSSEQDEVNFAKLPSDLDSKQSTSDYILGSIQTKLRDQIITGIRRLGVKILAWDIDLLCYARAASLLWTKAGYSDETRFAVVIGSNRTRLIILARDGRLFAPMLPLGIISFLEHLKVTFGEPTANPQWLDERKLTLEPTDSSQIRVQKIAANQAIFTLYAPFAQQVKMHLYQACSLYHIAPPKKFAVFGPGAQLFRITDGLELDLGMSAIRRPNHFTPELAASIGAALWDKHEVQMNCLPRGGSELIQNIKENLQALQLTLTKVLFVGTKSKPTLSSSFNMTKGVGWGMCVIALLSVFPIWSRLSTSNRLEKSKRELNALGPRKDQILEFSTRQTTLEKKLSLIKTLENKRIPVGSAVKEILSALPSQIRLNGLSIKENIISLKGVAQTQEDLEQYLELCANLRTVNEPTPTNVRREAHSTSFEISLKIRGRES